jgi:carboxyl-terminal processing protease
MKAGDIIIKVDGKDVTGQSVDQIVSQVRGKEGTDVTITLVRKGEQAPIELTITRAIITNPAVSWAMYPGTQTAVVRIDQFSDGSGDETVAALKAAKAAGATKFVLDLRNDPGGYVGEATQAASQFLKSGLVFIEQDAQGKQKKVPVEPDGVLTQEPLVVLVDSGSASASEIVSGAIQDAGRAKIVGETTFGTGTVLSQFDLSDGSALLVGTVQWLTPNGAEIWRKGITPDVMVSLPKDGRIVVPSEFSQLGPDGILKANDAQLQKAIDLLAQQ